jgi:hypothetical protein
MSKFVIFSSLMEVTRNILLAIFLKSIVFWSPSGSWLLLLGTCIWVLVEGNSQLNGLNVPDANIMPVTSTDDVLELMKLGQKNRSVGSTSLNDRSSRSHR